MELKPETTSLIFSKNHVEYVTLVASPTYIYIYIYICNFFFLIKLSKFYCNNSSVESIFLRLLSDLSSNIRSILKKKKVS